MLRAHYSIAVQVVVWKITVLLEVIKRKKVEAIGKKGDDLNIVKDYLIIVILGILYIYQLIFVRVIWDYDNFGFYLMLLQL